MKKKRVLWVEGNVNIGLTKKIIEEKGFYLNLQV
jgi:hypothetical protein